MRFKSITTALLLLCATHALSQEEGAPDMEAMMAAVSPGEQHLYLARYTGDWVSKNSMWMAPGTDPIVSYGTCKKEMIISGRHLHERNEGNWNGMPFLGIGLTGFDKQAKEFQNIWIDNFGTGIMRSRGTALEGGNGHTVSTAMKNPMTGMPETVRMVVQLDGTNRHSLEYYTTPEGGEEYLQMKLVYARAGSEEAAEFEKAAAAPQPEPAASEAGKDGEGEESAAAMAAWMASIAPGKEHELLSMMAGTFNAEVTSLMDPSAPGQVSTGTATGQMICDGRYLQETFVGDFGGMPFEGMAITAFDNNEKKFINVWVDNFGTGMLITEGKAGEDGKSFETTGDCSDPMGSGEISVRLHLTVPDASSHHMEYFQGPKGGELKKAMTHKYTRALDKKSDNGGEK